MQMKDQPMVKCNDIHTIIQCVSPVPVNWYLLREKKNQTPKLQAKGQIGNGMQ